MSYLIVEELRLHDGLLRSTTLCFILIAFCSACSQRTTKERSYNEKDLTHYDQIYSAEATFDRADYLPLNDIDTGYISGYYLSYRYKLQVHHIWKGSPEEIEYEYRCGVGDIKYYKPQLSEQDWNQIKKYSGKSPEIKLIYSFQRIEDTVMNECVEMKDYDESFTNRLQLGAPNKSYTMGFEPITVDGILQYFRYFEHNKANNPYIHIVDRTLIDAINALKLLGAQKAAIDYVDDDRFMKCSLSYSSLAVLTAIIENSTEFAAWLSNKFSSMLTCSDSELPIKVFAALTKNADMRTLQDNIASVLLNKSEKVKKYAAYYSVKTPSITHSDKEMLIKRMLSSENPDDRMFAAIMTKHFIHWAGSDVLARLCRAKNAEWHYENSSGSDSIGGICQELHFRVSQNMQRSKEIQGLVDPF